MNSEYPDEKQRAAVCYSQFKRKSADGTVPLNSFPPAKFIVGPPGIALTKARQEDFDAAGDTYPGAMLALWTPREVAQKLAQPGGEPPEDMHTTLGYYGQVGKDLHPDHIKTMEKCVAMAASGYKPVAARIGGVGRFNSSPSSGGKDVLIAHVDSPDLHDLRDHLIEHVKKCSGIAKAAGEVPDGPEPFQLSNGKKLEDGVEPFKNHGYTPHITLAYMDPSDQMPIHKLDRQDFTFTHLALAVGKQVKLFKLGEREKVAKSIWCPIVKADDEQRLATGIVLQPEIIDAQGDIIGADVIRASAHNFLAMYNKKTQLGLQHEVFGPDGVELVESWISPVDFELNNRIIKAGTWMMTVRVKSDAIWNRIKTGLINGFSIGGVAKVQRISG